MRERPKTAVQSQSGAGRSQNILPFLRKTCWAPPPVPSAQYHQTGEGSKLSQDFGRYRTSADKESGSALKKGLTSTQQDADVHTHSHTHVHPYTHTPPPGTADMEEDRSPWYLTLLKEKEQSLLTLGREITRLSGFESECVRKEGEISALRERLQEETRQLRRTNENAVRAQAELILDLTEEVRRLRQADEELQQKDQHIAQLQQEMACVQEEMTRLKEEITCVKEEAQMEKTQLREEARTSKVRMSERSGSRLHVPQEVASLREEGQADELPCDGGRETASGRGTELHVIHGEMTDGRDSSLMGEPCSEGDDLGEGQGHNELERAETKLITALEATNQALMTELEDARANNWMSTGALCSVRRALSVKEQELLTLKSDVETLRRDLKDRMTQIQAMSRRFSSMRDGRSRDEVIMTLEKDNYSLQQLVSRLQAELSEREESVSQLTLRVQARELEVLQERMQRRRLAQETQEQQDTLVELQAARTNTQAALDQTVSKYERLRMKVIQAVYSASGTRAPQKELTDAAIYYTMQKIIEDRSKFYQRLIQKGEKVPSLAISEAPAIRSGSISMGRRTSVVLGN